MFKRIFFISAFMITLQAQADSVHWKVGGIQGLLQARGNLILEQTRAVMSCQYCNVSTCAGGPQDQTVLGATVTPLSAHDYKLSVQPGIHSSGHFLKKISSCVYFLALKGRDAQTGAAVTGTVDLAYSRGNDSHPIWKNSTLAQELTEDLNSHPLQLEIQQKGLAEPAIYPVGQN